MAAVQAEQAVAAAKAAKAAKRQRQKERKQQQAAAEAAVAEAEAAAAAKVLSAGSVGLAAEHLAPVKLPKQAPKQQQGSKGARQKQRGSEKLAAPAPDGSSDEVMPPPIPLPGHAIRSSSGSSDSTGAGPTVPPEIAAIVASGSEEEWPFAAAAAEMDAVALAVAGSAPAAADAGSSAAADRSADAAPDEDEELEQLLLQLGLPSRSDSGSPEHWRAPAAAAAAIQPPATPAAAPRAAAGGAASWTANSQQDARPAICSPLKQLPMPAIRAARNLGDSLAALGLH